MSLAASPAHRLLAEVPIPRPEGPFGLLRVLGQALEYLDQPGAYAALLTLSGHGLRTPPPCPALPETAEVARETLAGLAALGWALAQVHRDPAGLDEPLVLAVVTTETAAGRPVLLGGWLPAPETLALAAGVTADGLICAHPAGAEPGAPYLAAAPVCRLAIVLGQREASPGGTLPSLARQAHAVWAEDKPGNAGAYRVWRHLLASAEEPPEGLPAALGAALATVAEARAAVRDHLYVLAEDLETLPGRWVERSAEGYDRLLELLEPCLETCLSPEAELLWRQEEWREELVARLEAVAAQDAEAAHYLRRAPEAEYGPEEEQ
jgi:hypothetical protein